MLLSDDVTESGWFPDDSMTSSVHVTSGALVVPGARLYYELCGRGPLLAIVGAPMYSAPCAPTTWPP